MPSGRAWSRIVVMRREKRLRSVPFPARTWLPAALFAGALLAPPAHAAGGVAGHEPIVGGPCERCEAVFQGLPAEISSTSRIAPEGEPGEPMRIVGTVTLADGTPAAGTIVYAYHTDIRGIYPADEEFRGQAAARHGRLRGWAVADENGRYRFDTIRPAGYPNSTIPQHVHMHVIEPGRCTYYIDDIVFKDDPRLTPERLKSYKHGRGGAGAVEPGKDADGAWVVERDIVLGEEIPDYVRCAEAENASRSR